jgi:hypothetical protein
VKIAFDKLDNLDIKSPIEMSSLRLIDPKILLLKSKIKFNKPHNKNITKCWHPKCIYLFNLVFKINVKYHRVLINYVRYWISNRLMKIVISKLTIESN